jgi:putative ABC transport system ATP-binding protein
MTGPAPSRRAILASAVTGQWRLVSLGAVLAAGHQVGEALVPVIIGEIIDRAVSTGATTALLTWLGLLAVVFAGLSYSFRYSARAAERAAEQAAHDLRIRVTQRILHPRGGGAGGQLSGELVNIAAADTRRVSEINAVLPFGLAAFAGVGVAAAVLLRISVPLGLVVLLGAPPLLWLAHLVGKPLERRSGVQQEQAARASGIAADLVTGLRVLKGIGAEGAAIARYRRISQESLTATVRTAHAQAGHDGIVLAFPGLFIAAVALVGGRLAVAGDISIGELVIAVGLAQYLLGPLQTLAWANGEFAQARASAQRISPILAAPLTLATGTRHQSTPIRGALDLRGVDHASLRGLTLRVGAGELVGVVAADPADATALLDCLAREADPAAGSVTLDGDPLSTLDPAGLRTAIVVATHDADLFEGSLRDNVGAGSPDAELAPALAAAAADEVARSLPRGLDTQLAERARSLSGGQRQRVALARALAADPPVLVVHDPTTAVDAVTEARIALGIAELRRGRTTVLVTTSPALLASANRVIMLAGGGVVAEGDHAVLVRDNADYRAVVLT